MKQRRLLAAGAALMTLPLWAAEPAPARKTPPATAAPVEDVDQDLLDFLGSVDPQVDDASWFDFLQSNDIGKTAKRKAPRSPSTEKKR